MVDSIRDTNKELISSNNLFFAVYENYRIALLQLHACMSFYSGESWRRLVGPTGHYWGTPFLFKWTTALKDYDEWVKDGKKGIVEEDQQQKEKEYKMKPKSTRSPFGGVVMPKCE